MNQSFNTVSVRSRCEFYMYICIINVINYSTLANYDHV